MALVFLPIMAFSYFIDSKIFQNDLIQEPSRTPIDSASGFAIETLINIKTVASLTLESERSKKYATILKNEEPSILKSSILKGVSSASVYISNIFMIGILCAWGGYLVQNYGYQQRDYFLSLFALILSLTTMIPAIQNLKDQGKVKAAMGRIFLIIDRKSQIDSLGRSEVVSQYTSQPHASDGRYYLETFLLIFTTFCGLLCSVLLLVTCNFVTLKDKSSGNIGLYRHENEKICTTYTKTSDLKYLTISKVFATVSTAFGGIACFIILWNFFQPLKKIMIWKGMAILLTTGSVFQALTLILLLDGRLKLLVPGAFLCIIAALVYFILGAVCMIVQPPKKVGHEISCDMV